MYPIMRIKLFDNSENVVQNKKSNSNKSLEGLRYKKKRANIITVGKLQLLF